MLQSNGDRRFTKKDAEDYVRKYGCWQFANPTDAIKRRDPQDYRELLIKLIETLKSRKDSVGVWETAAAKKELKTLGKGE